MGVDFVGASKTILAALNVRTMGMTQDERMRHVYNSAINDAINWVQDMGKKNPEVRLAYMRLEESMKEFLPLRSEQK